MLCSKEALHAECHYAEYRYAECHCAAKKHVKRRFVKKNHNFDKNEFGHTLMCSLSLT
jgi:hypothetical protein